MRICYGPGWRKRGIGANRRSSSKVVANSPAAVLPAAAATAGAGAPGHTEPSVDGVPAGNQSASADANADADAVIVAPEGDRATVRFQEAPTHEPSRNSVGVGPLDQASIAPRL